MQYPGTRYPRVHFLDSRPPSKGYLFFLLRGTGYPGYRFNTGYMYPGTPGFITRGTGYPGPGTRGTSLVCVGLYRTLQVGAPTALVRGNPDCRVPGNPAPN
eukprot:2368251-Rhodomonas_salina.1